MFFLADAVQKPFDVSTLMMLKMIILIASDGIWVCKNRRHACRAIRSYTFLRPEVFGGFWYSFSEV